MTNKEKYRQAFSALHAPDGFTVEVEKMEKATRHFKLRRMAAAAAACILAVSGASAAYAADVGGIQRTVQIWLKGDQTAATIEFDGNGSYRMEYTDKAGSAHSQGGGGVAYEADGTQRPLTEEELMEELAAPEVEYREDGSVWVYWYDQAVDITEKFEDGVCYVALSSGGKTQYLTIKYQNGYASSPHKYISPAEFN